MAPFPTSRGKVRNARAARADQLTQLIPWPHGFAFEAQMMLRVNSLASLFSIQRKPLSTASVAMLPTRAGTQKPIPTNTPMARLPRSRRQWSGRERLGFPENDPCAQKADAGHHALGHLRRIGSDRIERDLRHPFILVDGDQHQQCGCPANKRVSAKARRPCKLRSRPIKPPINRALPRNCHHQQLVIHRRLSPSAQDTDPRVSSAAPIPVLGRVQGPLALPEAHFCRPRTRTKPWMRH
jgi:hypothetical protein